MATKKTDLTEITPIKRFEHFLDSIAGGSNGEALDPISRIEEFLRRIAERESFQESEINRLSAIVPDPTSADTGKVLTASGEGTGSWEQASGGGGTATPVFRVNGDLYSESIASLTHVSGPTEEEIRARYAEGEVFPIAIRYTPVYLTNEAVIFSESATYEPGDGDRVQPRVDFYFPGIATGPEADNPMLNTDAGFTIALARGIVVVIQDSGGYAYKIANTNKPVEPGDLTGATPPVALFFNTIQD